MYQVDLIFVYPTTLIPGPPVGEGLASPDPNVGVSMWLAVALHGSWARHRRCHFVLTRVPSLQTLFHVNNWALPEPSAWRFR